MTSPRNHLVILFLAFVFFSCGNNSFFKQKYTNLKKQKTEFVEEEQAPTEFSGEVKVANEYDDNSKAQVEVGDVAKKEEVDQENNFSGNDALETETEAEVEVVVPIKNPLLEPKPQEDEGNGENLVLGLLIGFFTAGVVLMILAYFFFFSALFAGTLPEAIVLVVTLACIAVLIFGVIWLIGVFGGEVGFFGFASYFLMSVAAVIPMTYLIIYLISLI